MKSNEIIERINYYCKEGGYTLYRLSKITGVPLSTLTSIFIKGSAPSFETLSKICNGLGILLSDFFSYQYSQNMDNNKQSNYNKFYNMYLELCDYKKEMLEAYLMWLMKN